MGIVKRANMNLEALRSRLAGCPRALTIGALAGLMSLFVSCREQADSPSATARLDRPRVFTVTGVVEVVQITNRTAVIKHGPIPDYMPAMTMPFRTRDARELAGLQAGDEIFFRLRVSENESWIDQVTKVGTAPGPPSTPVATAPPTNSMPAFRIADIPDFALTNELRQPVSLRQFQGKTVALTFFFTRCPLPEYCPRLSRNFAGASAKLKALPNAPTNWHLLSISFDPFDTPDVLKAYAQRYRYDSNHWSFLTGKPEDIRDLARGLGVTITPEGGLFNHSFQTVIFDATARLQNHWPFGGDTSDLLVNELVKGATPQERE
jgi:protein SCO1/2